MNISVKPLNKLDQTEYKACHYLNLRGEGMMMYSLSENRTNQHGIVIMAWEKSTLLGWALMLPHGHDDNFTSTSHQRRRSTYVTQFYVRKPRRNEGVGAALMAEVKRVDKIPTVIPHDPVSADFFASYQVLADKSQRQMITQAKRGKKARAA